MVRKLPLSQPQSVLVQTWGTLGPLAVVELQLPSAPETMTKDEQQHLGGQMERPGMVGKVGGTGLGVVLATLSF